MTGGRAAPAEPALPVEFARDVQPVLARRCLGCHGVGQTFSRLDLRTRETALKGGARGAALVPGSAERSLLYQMVAGKRTPRMPPQGPLPAQEVATLRRWLAAGAPWTAAPVDAARQEWWSFKAPVKPAVPGKSRVKSRVSASRVMAKEGNEEGWGRNPIDAFVLQKLRAEGLTPSPPAPPRVLIRRVCMDLTGLPPTPEEVETFATDRAPDAYERLVDRLLASPHYGERWGRHWLDLVRYADSSGLEGDRDRPLAWRYRDYVIKSFNDDKPYDQFIREQLAGDELLSAGASRSPTLNLQAQGSGPSTDPRDLMIATAYLGCGVEDFAMVKLPMTRADELDDLVSTTGSVFLGLTLGCARCHDHKYDPVPQTDYYRLQAIFAPTERREVEIATPEERRAAAEHDAPVERKLAPLRAELAALRQRGEQAVVAAGRAKPNDGQAKAALPEADRKRWDELEAAIKAGEAKRAVLPKAMAVTDKSRDYPPVHLLVRGDANHLGPVVAPGFLSALPGGSAVVPPEAATPTTTGRRKALADWIASPQNPLTARVWMNRVWRQHFGRGLVNTPSNFGLNGELPSHPELLDYLAAEFMAGAADGSAREQGRGGEGVRSGSISPSPPLPLSPSSPTPLPWSLKPIHRLIVTSATYMQDSAPRAAGLRSDPQNRLLWRMPVRRLEAEAIRDSILAVAGTLNREAGGPPVYPPLDPSLRADTYQGPNWQDGEDGPKTWRRSVYLKVKRSLLYPQLEVFDCPEITASVAARNVTTTPTQALALLNDPLVLRQAALFAGRVVREAGADPDRQVDRAYRLAVCRPPTRNELSVARTFLAAPAATPTMPRLAEFCHALLNLNEFIYVP